jgi:hypothetical protein
VPKTNPGKDLRDLPVGIFREEGGHESQLVMFVVTPVGMNDLRDDVFVDRLAKQGATLQQQ